MLTKTELKQLHKEEFVESMRATVKLCLDSDPDKLQINTFTTALHNMVVSLDESLLYDSNKAFTEELEILDAKRDNAITGIRFGFTMFTYHKDPTKQEAAQLLLDRLDSYGNGIARMNYETESTILQNFVGDCSTEPIYKKAIMLLGLTEWIDEIESTNTAFKQKYQQRIKKESITDRTSIKTLKPEAVLIYQKLINRINAHVELDETGMYESLYDQLTILSDRYRQIIGLRSSSSSTEETDEVTALV